MKASRLFLTTVLFSFFLLSCSARSDEKVPGMPAAAPEEMIKIGVCMPSTGPLAELSRLQVLGMQTAGDMFSEQTGRNVEFVFRDTGETTGDFSGTLHKMIMEDHVSGIISCASADEVAAAGNTFARTPVPFVVTAPCSPVRRKNESLHGVWICTPLEDQAYACARFLSHELKARRIGLVIDGEDPVIVKIASLFSSELTRMPGRVVAIAYVQKGKDSTDSIARLMDADPDAVYMPFAGEHSFAVIEKVRSSEAERPLLVSNLPAGETLLAGAAKVLDGIYIQTDFIGETVTSPRGREFIEYYQRHAGGKSYLGSGIATGADGFFLLIEMISETRTTKDDGAVQKATSRKGSLLGYTGVTPRGASYPQLVFGKIQKRFLGGATVTYVAAITLNRSDPIADTGTQ